MPLLVSARGKSGADSVAAAPEIWSCGLWFRRTVEGTFSPSQAECDDAATGAFDSWAAFMTSGDAAIQGNFFLTEVRTYAYAETYQGPLDPKPGQLRPASVVGYSTQTATPQGSEGAVHPLQLSVALSLEAEGRVKPKRGRIYLPTTAYQVGADSLLSVGEAGGLLSAGKALLTSLDTAVGQALGFDVEACIQSRAGEPGAFVNNRRVRLLRVGRAIDTQRRRRNALPESYVDSAYP